MTLTQIEQVLRKLLHHRNLTTIYSHVMRIQYDISYAGQDASQARKASGMKMQYLGGICYGWHEPASK